MKKLLLVLAIAAMATTTNAQLWFGGSISFTHSGGVEKSKNSDVDKPSTNAFTLAPTVGFDLNDKLAVGGKLTLGTASTKSKDTDFEGKETETKTSLTTVGVTPFARYKFVEFNKFGLVAEAGLPISSKSSKYSVGGKSTKGDPTTSIGLYVTPLLTYSLNDNIQLECGLDFLSLNATHSVTKDRDDSNNKDITNTFNFGANTRNVATVGNITIGFIYKL